MRLRRRRPDISTGRRQRRPADPAKDSPFLYRSRRSDGEANTGRNQPREKVHKPADNPFSFLLRRFGLVILLIALAVSAVNVLSLSSNARIVPLSGSDSRFMQDKQVYRTAVDHMLAKSLWNHNKITVDTGGISRQMLAKFPELSSVSLTLPLVSKHPTVYIQTVQPALILVARNGSYVVDTNGKALMNAGQLSPNTFKDLPVVTDLSGLQVSLNHQALTSGDVSFIQTVIAELAASHVTVSALVLPPATSELDVHIQGQQYLIKFNLQGGDARQQAGTFLAAQAELKGNNVTPSQYVDVRVDGRAYYK